jgi:hypothetical protein
VSDAYTLGVLLAIAVLAASRIGSRKGLNRSGIAGSGSASGCGCAKTACANQGATSSEAENPSLAKPYYPAGTGRFSGGIASNNMRPTINPVTGLLEGGGF